MPAAAVFFHNGLNRFFGGFVDDCKYEVVHGSASLPLCGPIDRTLGRTRYDAPRAALSDA
jgi:hypothetical protein